MSFLSHIRAGTGVGLIAGVVSTAYFSAKADKLEDERYSGKARALGYDAEHARKTARFLATPSLLWGLAGGGVAGVGFYGVKRARKYVTPLHIKATIGTIFAAAVAYEVGKNK